MTDSAPAFSGEIPRNYDKYLGPLIFKAYAVDMANRISLPSAGRLLELAAGTGMATRELRDAIPRDSHMVVTDISGEMLEVARGKFQSEEKIEFQTADAVQLPFDDSSFDAIACQFSLMFFPDKLASLKEAARVLKPGGSFLFNIWDSLEHNHLARTVDKTVRDYMSSNPPAFFNVPYGYFSIDEVKQLLYEAGFGDIEISVLPKSSKATKAEHVALAFVSGTPLRLQIDERAPEDHSKIVDAVEQAIGNEFGFKSLSAKMQAIVFKAHYPG